MTPNCPPTTARSLTLRPSPSIRVSKSSRRTRASRRLTPKPRYYNSLSTLILHG
jgi:hypothetical protein